MSGMILAFAACSGSGDDSSQNGVCECEVGAERTCYCSDGSLGFQVCRDDCLSWYKCGNCGLQLDVTEQCVVDCTGLECGLDPVCGGSCGVCSGDQTCNDGVCVENVCEWQYVAPGELCVDFDGEFSYPGEYWIPLFMGQNANILYQEHSVYATSVKWILGSLQEDPLEVLKGDYFRDGRIYVGAVTTADDGYAYVTGIYSSSGKDEVYFDRYSFLDGTSTQTMKEWYPTSSFSDNELNLIRKVPGGAVYILSQWRYVSWSNEAEDIYFSRSNDNMATWSNWIQAEHVGTEGTVYSSRSAVVDNSDVMWAALTTSWNGGSLVVVSFDGTTVTHRDVLSETLPDITGTFSGAVVFLNRESGRIAFLYLDSTGSPRVRYNNVNSYGTWSSAVDVDSDLSGGINIFGNSEIYSPADYDKYFAVWNSKTGMALLQWDGNSTWTSKSLPKYRDESFYSGRVQAMEDGNPFITQTYTTGDSSDGYIVIMLTGCK